jgi:hypothetical protein
MVAGPPGTGKSNLCGTMAEYIPPEEILVIVTLAREANSLNYQKYDLDTVMISEDWRPADGKSGLQATGYPQIISVLRELRKDTKYSGIIFDNGTEAAEMAWHAALAPLGVGDPNDLGRGGNRFAPYTSLREKLEQMICDLALLTGKTGFAAKPKLVAMTWHIQPPKDSSDDGESADERGQGSEYEGLFLPMIRGSFRRRIGSLVDTMVFTDLVSVQKPSKGIPQYENHYCLQVLSDNERHCKIPGRLPSPDQLVKNKYLDVHNTNDAWRQLMQLMQQED